MAKAKHTPGPWKLNGVSVPGRHQIDAASDNSPVAITDARYDLHTGYEQADANARLIAAAPDLFAALEGFRMTPDAIVAAEAETIILRIPIKAIHDAAAALEKASKK